MPALQFLCLRFAFAFSFVRIFLCNFYMLTSDTSIRACLTICSSSSSSLIFKTPHGVPKRLPYAFACSICLQCVAATGHQMIDFARRQLSQADGDSFLSKSPTRIMRRRASTSRGPPPSWFTCSPCAACRWRSEVPGSAGLQAPAVPHKQNCRDGRSSDMRPCDLAYYPINPNLPHLAYWTGAQSTPRA